MVRPTVAGLCNGHDRRGPAPWILAGHGYIYDAVHGVRRYRQTYSPLIPAPTAFDLENRRAEAGEKDTP